MSNGYVQVPPNSTGAKVDTSSLSVAGSTVVRQRVVLASDTESAVFANITTAGALLTTGTFNISAMPAVALAAGAANIGDVNAISRTVQVAVSTPFTVNNISATVVVSGLAGLTAGTANIGFINNISATVVVAGVVNISATHSVILAAGTALIGDLNAISRTVQVAVGTPFTIQGISTTVTSVTRLSSITDLTSGAAVVIGDSANSALRVNVVAGAAGGPTHVSLDGGTANIGFINHVSATVQVAIATPFVLQGISTTVMVAGSLTVGGFTDNTTYSTGVTTVSPAGFIFFSASATAVTDGRAAAGRITEFRAQHINLRNNSGAEVGIAAAPLSVKVENTSATASVVLAAGTANIGTLNDISKTVSVVNAAGTANMGGVSLVAGTANIGFINNISATVLVAGVVSIGAGTALMGAVSLAAGTANIGFINGISATVSVVNAAGTANIGGVSLVAGTANIGFINNISATVSVINAAGTANIGGVSLVAGTANIGFINNISATVNVLLANMPTLAVPSTSHGPATITCSTSAVVVLVANPGDGLSTYITQLIITNAGTVSTLARIGTSATPSTALCYVASAGGGAVISFNPPWKLSASATAIASVKPNSSGNVYFLVNFYVAP